MKNHEKRFLIINNMKQNSCFFLKNETAIFVNHVFSHKKRFFFTKTLSMEQFFMFFLEMVPEYNPCKQMKLKMIPDSISDHSGSFKVTHEITCLTIFWFFQSSPNIFLRARGPGSNFRVDLSKQS